MEFYFYFMLILSSMCLVRCQDVTWTWIEGSEGSSVVATKSNPGGRSGAAVWAQVDEKAVWMFGGEYHVDNSKPDLKNDLWKYSLEKTSWTLAHNGTGENKHDIPGPRQLAAGCGVSQTYFVLFGGLDPKEKVFGDTWIFYTPDKIWYTLSEFRNKVGASNSSDDMMPAPRGDMAVWCTADDMFIFGGYDSNNGLHHDLWKFNLATLSWTQPKSSAELPTDPDFVKHLNYPNGRSGATTWVSGDRLFMFGGNTAANNLRSKHMMIGNTGDLWEYDKTQDLWTYHKGPMKVCNTAAQFGELGLASDSLEPGCRRRASAWTDSNGNLWMFGGDGIDNSQASLSVFAHSKLLSDIWFYDVKSEMWTWKGGETSGDRKGKFGEKGRSSNDYLPGSRCESVVWSLEKGSENFLSENCFFLFGGVGHDGNGKDGYLNDIWKLDVHLDQSVALNLPTAAPVFGMIFFSVGLVILISLLYLFSRKYFKVVKSNTNHVRYSRVPLDQE